MSAACFQSSCCPFVRRKISVCEILDEFCSQVGAGGFGICHGGIVAGYRSDNGLVVGRGVDARFLDAMYWDGSFDLLAKFVFEGREGVATYIFPSWNLDELEEFKFCCQALDYLEIGIHAVVMGVIITTELVGD